MTEVETLREALDSMLNQFAYDTDDGCWTTGGLSALEEAFAAMGWEDPHPIPAELICDEPGCRRRATCGEGTPDGYRRICGDHWHEITKSVKEVDDD